MNDAGHPVDEEQVGRELAAEFRRLMVPEPPFRTGLEEALRAAERDSRRRRARLRSFGGGAAVLAIAASAALVTTWPEQNRALPAPPAIVVPTDVTPTAVTPAEVSPRTVTPTPVTPTKVTPTRVTPTRVAPTHKRSTPTTPSSAAPLTPMDQLEVLVRKIAGPAGGSVTVDRDAQLTEVTASVKTGDGTFDVSAGLDAENDMAAFRESCQLDGSTCTELSYTPAVGVWARVRPSQPGRETLTVVAETADGRLLVAGVDNYVETTSGAKVVGPAWKDAGITASGMRKAVTGSPLIENP